MIIAFIQAQWHQELVNQCREGFLSFFEGKDYTIEIFSVPGSLEIPLKAKKLAKTQKYQAICCSGLITDEGIYEHRFVGQAVINGIMQVQLETEVPILSAVLTPQKFTPKDQKFLHQHLYTKGEELGMACEKILSPQ